MPNRAKKNKILYMSKFAVIKTGGKQYLVSPGQKIKIEKIAPSSGNSIEFDEVLLAGEGERVEFGRPFVKNAKVSAERLADGQGKKVMVARYHSKTRYYKRKGHRQPYTEVLIREISY